MWQVACTCLLEGVWRTLKPTLQSGCTAGTGCSDLRLCPVWPGKCHNYFTLGHDHFLPRLLQSVSHLFHFLSYDAIDEDWWKCRWPHSIRTSPRAVLNLVADRSLSSLVWCSSPQHCLNSPILWAQLAVTCKHLETKENCKILHYVLRYCKPNFLSNMTLKLRLGNP